MASSSSYLLASRYGYPLSSSSITHHSDVTHQQKRKLLSLSRIAATIHSASPNEAYFTFGLRTSQYIGVPLSSGRPYLIILSFHEDGIHNLRLKAFMIDILLNTLYGEYLDILAREIETRATNDLQNSTCSDTVGEDEIALSGDQFEVFEDHFIRPILEKQSVSEFWTAPLLNAYQDLMMTPSSPSPPTQSSLILTLFQVSSFPINSSPSPVQNFIPILGPSVTSLLPDIPLAIHALNLTTKSLPLYLPSVSSDGEEKAVIIAATHITNNYWIILAPWSLVSSSPLPSLSSAPSPLPTTSNMRFLGGLRASLQRFALFLPPTFPNFDPQNVGMISDLLNPQAPSQHDEGGLTPTPPPPHSASNQSSTSSRPGRRISR